MYRMIKANEEIPEDALVIDIELFYNQSITAAKRTKKQNKNIFPTHDIIIKNVKDELKKYRFKILHTNHSDFPGSPSTYYDTEITAKNTKTKKIIFVRVSNHYPKPDQALKNKIERPEKAKRYLGKDEVVERVDWEPFEMVLQGKSYTSWDIVFREIKKRIKDYAELNILK